MGAMDVRVMTLLAVSAVFTVTTVAVLLLGMPDLAAFFALCLLVVLLASNGEHDHDHDTAS